MDLLSGSYGLMPVDAGLDDRTGMNEKRYKVSRNSPNMDITRWHSNNDLVVTI